MNPKISIIIPAFNQGEYLEDCLESAYNQTVSAHEIIIINDGSKDDTLEIAADKTVSLNVKVHTLMFANHTNTTPEVQTLVSMCIVLL